MTVMRGSTDTNWITEGMKLAVYTTGRGRPRVSLATVERLTATQIVLSGNHNRFRRDTGRPVGDASRGWDSEWTELLPLDDSLVVDARAATRIRNLGVTIEPKLDGVKTLADALQALTWVEMAVADTRARVEALRDAYRSGA